MLTVHGHVIVTSQGSRTVTQVSSVIVTAYATISAAKKTLDAFQGLTNLQVKSSQSVSRFSRSRRRSREAGKKTENEMYHGDEDEKGEIREDDRNNKDNKDEDDDDKDGRRTRVSMLNVISTHES
ncbi:hypothetical protein E4U49_003855 [Claviceps purpurea]|nr:hypothetical protein E4U49_003855 [Claviceps purpurea]